MTNIDIKLNYVQGGLIGSGGIRKIIEQVLNEMEPLEEGEWSVMVNWKTKDELTVSIMAVN